MNESIHDILSACSEEQIFAILDYFRRPFRHGARKSTLVKRLADYLCGAPRDWLSRLLEPDLRLLERLCEAGADCFVQLPRPDYPSVLEVLSFIEAGQVADGQIELRVPAGFHALVHPHVSEVVAEKEADGSFRLERLILGLLNIYGVVPLRTFIDQLFKALKDEADVRTLGDRISACPLLHLYQETYRGEYYICSPFVDNFQEILQMRRITFKHIRKYAKVLEADATACGSHAPFCAYGLYTEEGQALTDMLKGIGYAGDELRKALHTIWMSAQYALDEDATEILFSPVTSRQDEIPGFPLFRDCIAAIVDYANIVPKWLLKGNNSLEADEMKLSVRVESLREEYGASPRGNDGNDPLEPFYRYGIILRPAAPDAPCPCGSGISFRHCHGKKKFA